jgi:hypothetical protein
MYDNRSDSAFNVFDWLLINNFGELKCGEESLFQRRF